MPGISRYQLTKVIAPLVTRGFVAVDHNGVMTAVPGKRTEVRAEAGRGTSRSSRQRYKNQNDEARTRDRERKRRERAAARGKADEAFLDGLTVTSVKIPASQLVAALPDSILVAEAERRGFSTTRNSIFEMVDWEK